MLHIQFIDTFYSRRAVIIDMVIIYYERKSCETQANNLTWTFVLCFEYIIVQR